VEAKKVTPLLKKSLSAAFPLRRFWGEKAVAQRNDLKKKPDSCRSGNET
jgi:hypothetical protein